MDCSVRYNLSYDHCLHPRDWQRETLFWPKCSLTASSYWVTGSRERNGNVRAAALLHSSQVNMHVICNVKSLWSDTHNKTRDMQIHTPWKHGRYTRNNVSASRQLTTGQQHIHDRHNWNYDSHTGLNSHMRYCYITVWNTRSWLVQRASRDVDK